MSNFTKGTYKIISTNAGFSKVERPDGILHNLSQNTIEKLKKQEGVVFTKVKIVKEPVIIEPADTDIVSGNKGDKPLNKMNKSELGEIAIRYNFQGDLEDKEITKAMIIEFIETEQAKG